MFTQTQNKTGYLRMQYSFHYPLNEVEEEHIRRHLWQQLILAIAEAVIDGREYVVSCNTELTKFEDTMYVEALVTLLEPRDAQIGEYVDDLYFDIHGFEMKYEVEVSLFANDTLKVMRFHRMDKRHWKRIL